jgi:hypothetical protein
MLGVALIAMLSAFVHWAHVVFTITFNERFELVLIGAATFAGICIASGGWSIATARRPAAPAD